MGIVTTLPRGRDMTRADLDALPDDGWRHELIDGALVMTPAPGYRHQDVVGHLHVLLVTACPADLKVMLAPFDVTLAENTVVEPDLLVARKSDFTGRDLPAAPLLAVEVLSPSTRRIDLVLKKSRYEAAGCPSYWVVDPVGPTVWIWEIEDGRYVERARVTGEAEVRTEPPFPLIFRPSDLVDPEP